MENGLFVVVTGRFSGESPFGIASRTGLPHGANQSEARTRKGINAAFSGIDTNGDGSISKEECEEFIFNAAYQGGIVAGKVAEFVANSTRDVMVNYGAGPSKNLPAKDLKVPEQYGTRVRLVRVPRARRRPPREVLIIEVVLKRRHLRGHIVAIVVSVFIHRLDRVVRRHASIRNNPRNRIIKYCVPLIPDARAKGIQRRIHAY